MTHNLNKANLPSDNKKRLATLKLPLVMAVSSCLLVACSSTPTAKKGVIETTPIAVAPPNGVTPSTTMPTQPVSRPTAVVQVPPTTNMIQPVPNSTPEHASGLDPETLALLAELLEARDMSMVQGDIALVEKHGDLWQSVRQGYGIRPVYNQRIANQQSWFKIYGKQGYLNSLTARASRYLHYTTNEAKRRGIPTELALLPIIESSYDPAATSNAAAAGLWQFIPSTGRIYGLNQSEGYDGRRDVIESTRAAYDFLTSLYNQFGSWELALAAYNAGPARVQRAIDANRSRGLSTDYWSLNLPKETMNYVPRFFAVAQIISDPAQHGMSLPPIADQVYFRVVPVKYDVTLEDIAYTINVPLAELQLLNPALTRSRIDRAGPARVVIPNAIDKQLDAKIQSLGSPNERLYLVENTHYIPPRVSSNVASADSANQLKSIQALPTTGALITTNNTVQQEPPLTEEERQFIAQQIRQSDATIQPINNNDGRIELNALQTAQSVLDSRKQTKHLNFPKNPVQPTPTTHISTQVVVNGKNTQTPTTQKTVVVSSTVKPTTYVIKQGDTLSSIAAAHGVTVAQLRQWNDLTDDRILFGTRLKLYGEATAVNQNVVSNQTTSQNNAANNAKSSSTKSSNTQPSKPEKYKVQSGDTLTGVANMHGMTVAQLADYNNLDVNAKLIRGQNLWLVADKLPKAKKDNKQSENTQKSVKLESYKIQAGDTLIGVANRYDISVAQLAEANNLSTEAGLIRGKTLQIPVSKTTSKTPSPQSSSNQSSGQPIASTEAYKVQSGDTLTALSERYQVSIGDLAKTNNLSSNARLVAGQTIKVPKLTKTHIVKSGESLNALARQYGIDVKDLAKMNNLKPTDGLRIGQKLTVPNK